MPPMIWSEREVKYLVVVTGIIKSASMFNIYLAHIEPMFHFWTPKNFRKL